MTTHASTPLRRTVDLADGRVMSYLELGDPDGSPVLFTMGSPSSAIGALAYAPAAGRNGIKLISLDKPGYGRSTRDPGRSLLRYGDDVRQVADALGLQQVALAGQSGGGPHALAAAYVLGVRVAALCLLCTAGPFAEPWARRSTNGLMRTTNWFARRAPALMPLPVSVLKVLTGNPERLERMQRRMETKLSPQQRAALNSPEARHIPAGLAEAFRDGLPAVCDEFRVIGRPWGFDLSEILAPTDFWHGTDDLSCHIDMARGMAQRMPNATLHELPDQGHVFFGEDLDGAMRTLRDRAPAGR